MKSMCPPPFTCDPPKLQALGHFPVDNYGPIQGSFKIGTRDICTSKSTSFCPERYAHTCNPVETAPVFFLFSSVNHNSEKCEKVLISIYFFPFQSCICAVVHISHGAVKKVSLYSFFS